MAKKTNYLGNVAKEVKQTAKNASNAVDKYLNGNRVLPKGMKIGPSNVKKEVGQLAGAVLQGRRYDEKGKQVLAKKPNVSGTTVKTTTYSLFPPAPKKTTYKVERTTRKPLVKRVSPDAPARQRGGTAMPKKSSSKAERSRSTGTPLPKKVSPNTGRSRSTGTPMPRGKVSPNANRPPLNRTPMPKKVSPNANRPSYRGGPLRRKKDM